MSRSWISLSTRSPIWRSRALTGRRLRRKSAVSLIGSAQTSAMFMPPCSRRPSVTAIETGLSRLPLQAGHGHLAHEALEPLAAGVGLGLAVPALDVGADALELGVVGALRGRSGCG